MKIFNQIMFSGVKISTSFLIVIFYSSMLQSLTAQNERPKDIITSFKDYGSAYREVAYCHLNKSIYIKGEILGFSSYVMDKNLKIPSQQTKNLYCVISDSTDNVIKSKLIKIYKGFANNVFNIDSLFTSGYYTFKAYTNWMNNFDERNAYIEMFRVIDPKADSIIQVKTPKNILDAQFLPEGGHFIDNVKTNVGVVVKNINGRGVPNIEGDIFDSDNNYVTKFETNSLGIGKFLLFPKIGQEYKVKINHLDESFEYIIDDIKLKGISIHLNDSKDRLVLELKSNERTLKDIEGKPYKITFHNGNTIKSVDIKFNTTNLVKIIKHEELLPGINIFTLFNENDKPVLERMFFNYDGINFFNSKPLTFKKQQDSLFISIPFDKSLNSSLAVTNMSISVLPDSTKSYQKHNNIISYTYLQPYMNGYIENATYYFSDINREKKYDLDNLLITQGWSSFNWDNIFKEPNYSNIFEKGINVVANVNLKKGENYLVYPLKNNISEIFELNESDEAFNQKNLYPEDGESYKVGLIKSNDRIAKPGLYVQFYPSKIPAFKPELYSIPKGYNDAFKTASKSTIKPYFSKKNDIQELDEILIEVEKKVSRIKSIKNRSFGRIDFFDEKKRRPGLTLASYLSGRGFNANDNNGILSIVNPNPSSPNNPIPLVILDGVMILDFGFLSNFSMQTVDYIEINKTGIGYGLRGGGGVINIVTNPDLIRQNTGVKNTIGEYEFPLAFAEDKKYYVPKYDLYNDDFFKEYGVIDWIPNCKIDNQGNLNFTIYNPAKNNIKLFIEGVTEKGEFISEIKGLNVNNNQ